MSEDLHSRYARLAPRGKGLDLERFEEYFARVSPLLPGYPEGVLKDWFHRHWVHAVDLWGWIGLDRLQFRLERWPTNRILTEVQSINPDAFRGWAKSLQESRDFYESWLGSQMIQAGTWPTAPIVLDNISGLTMQRFGRELQLGRYCLLEGLHRLAYLHGLDQHPDRKIQSDHELWLAEIN